MGFGIDNHGKLGFTVQDDHAENSSSSQNAQGGKPGAAHQGGAATPEAGGNQTASTPPSSAPPSTHDTTGTHSSGSTPHQESIADKKAKGLVTGDEVVANLQATAQIQTQLLSQSPPLPNDQDPGVQGIRLSASDAQRLFASMGDINAQLMMCEQDSSSDNHQQVEDSLKKLQDEITKREAFNSRFAQQFDKIMGEIGADASQSKYCRNNDLQNDALTKQLEAQLGLTPDQAVALVQGIRDGGAAGIALALSLATLMTDKGMEDSGFTTDPGSAGAGNAGDPNAGADVSANAGAANSGNTDGVPGVAASGNTGATANTGAVTDVSNDNGLTLTATQKAAEDKAINADVLQLVADAQAYDNSGSLFGGPDPASQAAQQLLQDAMNVLATGMSGVIKAKGDANDVDAAPATGPAANANQPGGANASANASANAGADASANASANAGDATNTGDPANTGVDPTNDDTALSPGNFNQASGGLFISMVNQNQFSSPTAALNAILSANTEDIGALQKAAAMLLVEAAAGRLVTQAIELAATNAGNNVHNVFNPSLTQPTPVGTRA